jgi:hypothetical protein
VDATEVQPEALRRQTGHDIDAADADDLVDVTALSTDERAQRDDLTVRPEND